MNKIEVSLSRDLSAKRKALNNLGLASLLGDSKIKNFDNTQFVSSMIIDLRVDHTNKIAFYSLRVGTHALPHYGEESNRFYKKVESIQNKRFYSVAEAVSTLDSFVNEMNENFKRL